MNDPDSRPLAINVRSLSARFVRSMLRICLGLLSRVTFIFQLTSSSVS